MDVCLFNFLARQSSASVLERSSFCGVSKRSIVLVLVQLVFWQPLLVHANGIAVTGGTQTTIGQAGNGVPIVNIAAPNASGLSHNKYEHFNVGRPGVILNNATHRTHNTQLGGIILGNQNLQGRASTLILNEVVGANSSQLNGYTEVAGQSARVIVANPYGISCNGCGFINTPRVTLTTGKPVLESGHLDRYQVDGGIVSIDGVGLDVTNVDQFEIITRSAQINAELHANQLDIISGRNNVNAHTLSTSALSSDGSIKPRLAIDSTVLGGMYAGAIRLIGTETGVGVRLAGHLAASGGDIQINTDGQLAVAQAASTGMISINAADVQTQGVVYGSSVDVQARDQLSIQQNIAARDGISLRSGGQLTNSAIVEAGVNADRTRNAVGDVSINAHDVRNNGNVIASRALQANAVSTLNNQGGTLSGHTRTHISAATVDNRQSGRLLSQGEMSVTGGQIINAQTGQIASATNLLINAEIFDNTQRGKVSSDGTLSAVISGQLLNGLGMFSANGNLSLHAVTLDNRNGEISSLGGMALSGGQADNGDGGRLLANGDLSISYDGVSNQNKGAISGQKSVSLNLGQLSNGKQGSVYAKGNLDMAVANAVDNAQGVLRSDTGFDLLAGNVTNDGGTLTSGGALRLTTQQVNNGKDGRIASALALTASVTGLDQQDGGHLYSDTDVSLDLNGGGLNNQGGLIKAPGQLLLKNLITVNNRSGEISSANGFAVKALDLQNDGGSLRSEQLLDVRVGRQLSNTEGLISAKGLKLHANEVVNDSGLLSSDADLLVTVGSRISNREGELSAAGNTTLIADSINNFSGQITADRHLTLNVNGAVDNSGGTLGASNAVRLQAESLDNRHSAVVVSDGDLRILLSGKLDNQSAGTLRAKGSLNLQSLLLDNRAGIMRADKDMQLSTGALDNSNGGKVIAGTVLGLAVDRLINRAKGVLSGDTVYLDGNSFDNRSGSLVSQSGSSILLGADLSNSGGLISSRAGLSFTVASLDNSAGSISSSGALTLASDGDINNRHGSISTNGDLSLTSAGLDNSRQGTLSGKGETVINTGTFDNNHQGQLTSGERLTLIAVQVNNRDKGRIAAAKDLAASLTGLDQQGGELYSNTSLSLDLRHGHLNNQSGLIKAPGALLLQNLAGVNNQDGEIASGQGFTFTADSLDNTNGRILSNQPLIVRVANALRNVRGSISAASLEASAASLDNTQGMLSSRGTFTLRVDRGLINHNAKLIADGNLLLTASSVDNSLGQIAGNQDLIANIGSLKQQGGQMVALGSLSLTGSSLDNSHNGLLSANRALTLNLDSLDNQGGEISSQDDISVFGRRLDNSDGGRLTSQKILALTIDQLINRDQGVQSGNAGLTLTGTRLDNSGGRLLSQQKIDLTLSGDLLNNAGLLNSEGLLSVRSASLDNDTGSLTSGGTLALDSAGSISNQGGKLVADGRLDLTSMRLDNTHGGSISGKGPVSIHTGDFNNSHKGHITTADSMTLTAGHLSNSDGGSIGSGQALVVSVSGLDQQGGTLFSGSNLSLDLNHGQLDNLNGLINAPGALLLRNLGGVNNQNGEISSTQGFNFNANSLDNSNGKLLSGQALIVRIVQGLDNVKGLIAAASLNARAGTLDNGSGALTSRSDLTLDVNGLLSNQNNGQINADNRLDATSHALDNRGGLMLGSTELALRSGDIDNRANGLINSKGTFRLFGTSLDSSDGGEVSAIGAMDLSLNTLVQRGGRLLSNDALRLMLNGGDLNNERGLIGAKGGLTFDGLQDVNNRSGEISSTQAFNITSRHLNNGNGKLISNQQLILNAPVLHNHAGLISGWEGMSVTGGSLDNRNNGTVSSRKGDVSINLTGALLNGANGALVSQKALHVAAVSVDNRGGILSSGAGQTYDLSGLLDNSQGGLIDSGAALTVRAQALSNGTGTINAQQELAFTGASLDNSAGSITGKAGITLDLLGTLSNTNGKLASAGDLLVTRANQINNQGGQLVSQRVLKAFTGGLDNSHRGTVAANGPLLINASGLIQNSNDGLIYSKYADLHLQASSLNNGRGTLQSQGGIDLLVLGDIDNQTGKIIAQGDDFNLTARSVDNRGGILSSLQKDFIARLNGRFINGYDANRQGGIAQGQSLSIKAVAGIDNHGGRLSAQSGDALINTGGGNFDNRTGGVYAKQRVSIYGNNVDNRGQITGQQIDLNLIGNVNNRLGSIESNGGLSISASNLDNQTGRLRALGTNGVTRFQIGGSFDNRNGTLETATADLELGLGDLLNAGGSILHVGTGHFGMATADVINAGGSLVTRGLLNLNADSWTNSSVLQAGTLNVNVNNFTQTAAGQLLASEAFVGSGGHWVNDGLIASEGVMKLSLGGTYAGNGQLSSMGDLALNAGQVSQGQSGRVAGGGHTDINVVGAFSNHGRVTSGAGLLLSANSVFNRGTLGSAQQLTVSSDTLVNDHGLIFSGDAMSLRVSDFVNSYADVYSLASLSIDRDGEGGLADRIVNSSSSIQSDGAMNLAAATIENIRALLTVDNAGIYAAKIKEAPCIKNVNAGDCSTKRNHIWELIEREKLEVTAASAASSISTGGNLSFTGDNLVNRSSTLATSGNLTAMVTHLSNVGIEPGDTERTRVFRTKRTSDPGYWYQSAAEITDQYWHESANYTPDNIGGLEAAVSRFIATTETELPQFNSTQKLAAGDQTFSAVIQAAGKVDVSAEANFDNNVVRAGYTHIGSGPRTNTDIAGTAFSTKVTLDHQLPPDLAQLQINPLALPGFRLPAGQNGLFRLSRQDGSNVALAHTNVTAHNASMTGKRLSLTPRDPMNPLFRTNDLRIATINQSAVQTKKVDIKELSTSGPLTVGAEGAYNHVVAPIRQPLAGRSTPLNTIANVNAGPLAPTALPSVSHAAVQPLGAVQVLPATTGSPRANKYLIETNPALTELKQFMSSDYLLTALGYNSDVSAKRLGDGLYEQRLVQQAVTARTGQAFIEGQHSNQDQFKFLMNNAIASKGALDLAVGVSLTAEQVAALTHDIVWLEEHEVNGENVLVPVLYLAHAKNRLAPSGALVQGSDVTLIAGKDLANAGTLKATQNLSIIAGQHLVNTGLIHAGNRLDLLAGSDIANRAGGTIAGRDVSLTAIDGDVINERTVTAHKSGMGTKSEQRDFSSSAARIEAANNLIVWAGRDISNIGSTLQAGRALALTAGRDVNIAAAQTKNSLELDSRHRISDITQTASTITAGRDLSIQAGRDVKAIASQIDAKRDILIGAARDITFSSAADEVHSYGKGKRVTAQEDRVRQVSTKLNAGGDVAVEAGNDVAVLASTIKAASDLRLDAGRDVYVASAQNKDYSYYKKKKKGSFGSGSTRETEQYGASNVASVIDAGHDLTVNASQDLEGRVNIHGGRNVTVAGSTFRAGNDMLIGARGDVSVVSAGEESGASSKTSKSGAFDLKKTGKREIQAAETQVGTQLQAANDAVVVAGRDVKLSASSLTAGRDAELHVGLVDAAGDINLVSASNSSLSRSESYKSKVGLSLGGNSDGISLGVNTAKKRGHEVATSSGVGSQVIAGRDAILVSPRDINITGSSVDAQQTVAMSSGRDINIIAGANSSQSADWKSKKDSGLSITWDRNGFTGFIGDTTVKDTVGQGSQTAAVSHIAGGNVKLDAERAINIQGSDIYADSNLTLEAGRDIRIDSTAETRSETNSQSVTRNGISATVNHNYGKTIDALKDIGQGDDAVSKVSSVLKAAETIDQFLRGATMDGSVGNTARDGSLTNAVTTQQFSTLNAGNDISMNAGSDVSVRGSSLQAGRDINVKGKNVTFHVAKGADISAGAQHQSKGGIVGGTTGGFKLGIGGSSGVANQDASQGTSGESQLSAGRNINLAAGEDLSLIGTQLQANRDIRLKAGNDLTILAAQNESTRRESRHSGGGEVGLTAGADGIGVYASVNIGRGDLDREAEKQQQAYLHAGNKLRFESGRDTTIAGGTLEADDVIGNVGRDLTISSVPDTGKVRGKEFDVSATVTVGYGGSVSGSVGYGQTSGSTHWVGNQTSIAAKDRLDIRTEQHTQLDGAVLSSENGNLKLDTATLGYSDIAGKDKEHGYYLNGGGSYGWGASGSTTQDSSQAGKGKEGESSWSVSGFNYEKDREQTVRATVGAGDIIVRNDPATGNDSVAGLNRDLSKAYEVTRDEQHRTDVYASSASVELVTHPLQTAQDWKKLALNYDETVKARIEKVAADSASLWNEIQDQIVTISQIPKASQKALGNQLALDSGKNLLRAGLDPALLNTLPSAVATQIGNWAACAAGSCLETPTAEVSSTDMAGNWSGNTLLLDPTNVESFTPLMATFLKQTSELIKEINKLPREEAQIAMLAMQAAMGPAKAAVSLAAGALIHAALGEQYEKAKEDAAIALTATLTESDRKKIQQAHEDAKAAYTAAGRSALEFDGDAQVVAAEFLIDLVVGGVQSLGGKAVGREISAEGIIGRPGASSASAKATATTGEVVATEAASTNAQAALRAKLSGLQKAQETAAVTRTLPDGRIRYYTQEVPARTEGPTRGASFATEFDPKTGSTRQWMESYDHAGEVIRVHPKSINGQPVDAQHYPPTGAELKNWGQQ